MECPYCKSEINEHASVCPKCNQNLMFHKHPGCTLPLFGLSVAGCGIWLIWIPFLGIPLIAIGLLIAVSGLIGGTTKTIKFFVNFFKKNKDA